MAQYELNLRDYLRIFRKRRFTIVATFILIAVLSLLYLYSQPVIYRASTTIKIEERKSIAGLLTEWIMYNPGDIMESHTKSIKSFPVMREVAKQLKLITDKTPEETVNATVGGLQDRVEPERVQQTNMIKITAVSENAQDAMNLANKVATVYIDANLNEKAAQAKHVRLFIEEQLRQLEHRLKESEERVQGFNAELKSAKLSEPLQQKLVELEFQLSAMLQKYTEKHPSVIALKEQIKELEGRVSDTSTGDLEYGRLMREIDVNKKLYAMLKEKLEEARITEAQKVGDIAVVNPAFLPDAPASGNRSLKVVIALMMGILLGFTAAFIVEMLDSSISTIEDVERVVKLPILGVIPSIESEVAREESLMERLKERFVPHHHRDDEQHERLIRLIAHHQPQSSAAEAYRNVLTNLKPGAGRKTILITSSGAREGKTTVTSNLGIVTAQTGQRTVLVSADMRRPTLARMFGITREPGLSDYLSEFVGIEEIFSTLTDIMVGEMDFDEARKTPGLENLTIIPAGKIPANPVQLLGMPRMKELIEELKRRFDVVIFDVPPVLPVTDACVLAPFMDSVVLVYEIGRTSREALLRTKIQLETVGSKISGIVLNNTQANAEAISLYPYYSRYKYRYYAREHGQKRAPVQK